MSSTTSEAEARLTAQPRSSNAAKTGALRPMLTVGCFEFHAHTHTHTHTNTHTHTSTRKSKQTSKRLVLKLDEG